LTPPLICGHEQVGKKGGDGSLSIDQNDSSIARAMSFWDLGPKSFDTRAPPPGGYSLKARFYGESHDQDQSTVTAEMEITRNFGMANEVFKRFVLRVSEKKAEEVATVKIPAVKCAD